MGTLHRDLNSLVIFRHILQAEPMQRLNTLLTCPEDPDTLGNAYADFVYALLQENGDFSQYLLQLVLEDENIYTRYKTTGHGDGEILEPLLDRELRLLSSIAAFDGSAQRESIGDPSLAAWKTQPIDFVSVYHTRIQEMSTKGFGVFAKYHMFMLDDAGGLVPIKNPDPQQLTDLFGYEKERGKVIANTKALLEGRPANNVLLYGDAGTGKSSTVKAIGNAFANDGLRMVELKKNQLYLIPGLLDTLAVNPLKFILFIDDLAFDQDDNTYSVVKTILEGGLEKRPDNVAIYATSNRRLLVRQTFSDRAGDEVDIRETIAEKTALSDRFGLRIPYLALNKAEFLELIEQLADQAGVSMDRGELMREAVKWDMKFPGRTPRGARQFIASLSAR